MLEFRSKPPNRPVLQQYLSLSGTFGLTDLAFAFTARLGFVALTLAHALNSLVRVSRRVGCFLSPNLVGRSIGSAPLTSYRYLPTQSETGATRRLGRLLTYQPHGRPASPGWVYRHCESGPRFPFLAAPVEGQSGPLGIRDAKGLEPPLAYLPSDHSSP
jgi:hypothetical protein